MFLIKDYGMYYTSKIIRLRRRIQKKNCKLLKLVRMVKYKRLLFRSQSFLPISKSISNDIVFPHGLCGIFISNGATIKEGCVIFQQVTIGSNSLKDSKNRGYPTIGKNCYIGVGAKIIGSVNIGDNVRIGANAVVTKDIPSNATVVGARCRVIEHDYELGNRFVAFKKGKSSEK